MTKYIGHLYKVYFRYNAYNLYKVEHMFKYIITTIALVATLYASHYENGDEAYEDGNIKIAVSHWEKGAKAGELESQFMLGLLYLRGDDIEADTQKAASLLAKTFNTNEETLQITIALVYYKNRGHEPEDEKAAQQFETAIDNEGAIAQYNLGMMFVEGSGVDKNLKKGALFIKKAKNANLQKAKNAWKKHNLGRY